ncbi:hypothetical protein H5410_014057 [Solanum commersonii]|uniref:Uncharacterized protein n=1 Tax=Solanum commersonii TaxID=4109 RepID=A0A9J5ZPX0_SOLCO|nr:hypothetical protein H5410_014057 [Solanum commersonii]
MRVTFVVDKLREARLRWFEHVKRCEDPLVRRCEMLDIVGTRREGSPEPEGRGRSKRVLGRGD